MIKNLPNLKPRLASEFERAVKDVYDFGFITSKNQYEQFRVLESHLRKHDVSAREYAQLVCKLYKNWITEEKNLAFIPVKLFLSERALERFLKVYTSENVSLNEDDTEARNVLDSELLVIRMWISKSLEGECPRIRDCVEDLRPMLAEEWLDLYDNDSQHRPDIEALDILCEEYGVYASSYIELLEMISSNE